MLTRYFRTVFPDVLASLAFQDIRSDEDMVNAAFSKLPGKVVKPSMLEWAGWKPEGDQLVYDEATQKFFTPLEVDLLFGGGNVKQRNDWLTEVREVPVTLELYLMLGCRWELDCGGSRPTGIRLKWDPQTGEVDPESETAVYLSIETVASYMAVKKESVPAEEESDHPMSETGSQEGEDDQNEEGNVEAERAEAEREIDRTVEWLPEDKRLGGEGEVVMLRVFDGEDKGKKVVPDVNLVALGLGKAKGLEEGVLFDLERGGVDAAVLFAKPCKKELKDESGEVKEQVYWMPEEEWVRGMSRLMGKVLAKGSVLVLVAPLGMRAEWMEGLEELETAWTFYVRAKVRRLLLEYRIWFIRCHTLLARITDFRTVPSGGMLSNS